MEVKKLEMKNIISILLLVLALSAGIAFAGTFDGLPEDITKSLQLANKEIYQKYGYMDYYAYKNENELPVNKDLLRTRALIVFGSPHDHDPATGHNRYLGETMAGEKYTNTLFRHDPNPTPGLINDWNWIPNPWRSDKVKQFLKDQLEPRLIGNNFNENPEFNDSIIRGLESYHQGDGAKINFVRDNTPWHTYVHVLQPPTDYTWGMGRMWHQRPDGIRYLTVPMAPLIKESVPDFSTELAQHLFKAEPGETIQSVVRYKLNEDHPQPETAKLRLDHLVGISEYPIALVPVNPADAPNAQGVVEFQPGEVKEYRYEFTVQNQSRKIISRINPVSTDKDSDWSNNRDEAIISGDVDIAVQAWPIKNGYIIPWNMDSLTVGANVRVTRKDSGSPVNVKLTINGPAGQKVHEFILDPEGAKTEQYYFTVSNAGAYTVTAEAWPVDANDMYPQDNVDSTTINVTKQSRPSTGPKEPDLRGEIGG